MAITHGYCTLAQMKSWVPGMNLDTSDDALLELAVESASRSIDRAVRRRHGFWQDGSVVDRVYTCEDPWLVITDDISTSSGLIVKTDDNNDGTFETTWTITTDFRLAPVNAAADGEPWTHIVVPSNSTRRFPYPENRIQVTAKFGWAAVPTDIKLACQILAMDLFKAKDSPFGVAGWGDLGVLRVRENATVAKLITPYIRREFSFA